MKTHDYFLILMCILFSFFIYIALLCEPSYNQGEPKVSHMRLYIPNDFMHDIFSFKWFLIFAVNLHFTENNLRNLAIYVTKRIPSNSTGILKNLSPLVVCGGVVLV